jgi:CubicO group peptidase (beta-lactamase class C family)
MTNMTTQPRPWRRAAGLLLVGALAVSCSSDDGANGADGASARPGGDPWEALAATLDDQYDFSGAVLVAQDGEPLLEAAYGDADRDAGTPNDIDTRFNLASVSKMFTGVAIAQLVEAGDLSFEDTIGDHLDGFAPDVAAVTIDQLLTHTSGLGDYLAGGSREEVKAATTATELLPLITGEQLQFTPGERESYSNSGYTVLGAIVEAVSDQSFYDYVRSHIFEPAGMTRTDWPHPGDTDDNTALGYTGGDGGAPSVGTGQGQGNGGTITLPPPGQGNGGTVTLPPPGGGNYGGGTDAEPVDNSDMVPWGNPSGGAYSTVGDLLRFAQALLDHELLGAEMTETVMSGKVPMSGGQAEVAYGFTDGTRDGVRVVGHGGGAPGVGATFDIYLDAGVVVVILANTEGTVDPVRQAIREVVTAR